MHFAPIAVAIALLAAQPALSAPAAGFSPNGGVPTRTALSSFRFQPLSVIRPQHEELAVFARELEDLLARSDLDGSEALSFPSIFKTLLTAAPTVLNLFGGGGSSQPQPTQTAAPAQRRDFQELEARTSFSELIRQINEGVRTSNHIIDVNQRSIDESGALLLRDLVTTVNEFIPIYSDGGSSHPQPTQTAAPAQRRDLQELEARTSLSDRIRKLNEDMRSHNHIINLNQRSIDESGALSLRDLVTTVTKLIPGIGKATEAALKAASKRPKRSTPAAREFMDVLTRALEARELNELD